MTSWNPDLFSKAWDFATHAHHGQTYGGPVEGIRIDYINHIGSVAVETIWTLNNSNVNNPSLAIQCAVLHDVVEDTNYSIQDISDKFGKDVANGVAALTKNTSLPNKEEQMKDSLRRIKEQPYEVWVVKMADRTTNLYHPPHYWNNEKKLQYIEEAKLIHSELKEANQLIADRLLKKIEDYKKYIK